MKIALVTYNDEGNYPGEGSKEDARLLHYLQHKGLDVTYEIWTNQEVNWEQYDQVVLKSPWDYFDKIDKFRHWLSQMETRNIHLLNPINIVRWNADKRYLLDIEVAGLGIVPTQIIEQYANVNLPPFYETWQTDKIIVKPAVSGGAKNTLIISKGEIAALEPQVTQLLTEEAYLVQPFMPEVQTEGEWSLLYFNGKFSHCILKVPKSGDFRVQHYFGGAIIPTTPPEVIRSAADKLITQFTPGCLYARVDGLHSNNTFKLMELELIEPMLYIQENDALYENYYRALVEMVGK